MLLLRGATSPVNPLARAARSFNTCSSCEEQRCQMTAYDPFHVSIPAPLARSNRAWVEAIDRALFQYLLLLRGATCRRRIFQYTSNCFNTCSSCEEQLSLCDLVTGLDDVSIPAPLARSNTSSASLQYGTMVSIPAPLARSNSSQFVDHKKDAKFQYLLLLRGATRTAAIW